VTSPRIRGYSLAAHFVGDKSDAPSDASLQKAVSAHATSDGNVETGDVAEDAVIRVDNPAGCSPDPGHRATGGAVEVDP
jgi:hypothetical protein